MGLWTEELTARVVDAWRAGDSASDIARVEGNGLTRSAVLGKMKRLGINQGAPSPARALGFRTRYGRRDAFAFSEQDDQTIVREIAAGVLKQYEIADLIGCNSNQIVTRIKALRKGGLLQQAETHAVNAPKPPKVAGNLRSGRWSFGSGPNAFQPNQRIVVGYRERAPDPLAPPPALDLRGARFTILTVGDRFCRWPHGDPSADDFHLCGNTNKPGSAYCPYHHRRAHYPSAAAEAA